ncbi:MAG: hypothetical protein FWE95_04050, partial [Planctomycetaceae bacterium]|nr:hypothetical protein [Planctomycetaceae bacterium]
SPHRSRYWLNAKIEDPQQCEQQIEKICEVYLSAAENEAKGILRRLSLKTLGISEKEYAAIQNVYGNNEGTAFERAQSFASRAH